MWIVRVKVGCDGSCVRVGCDGETDCDVGCNEGQLTGRGIHEQ